MPYYDGSNRSRLTRGEKCLLMHLTVTVAAILVLAIIYAVHVFTIEYAGDRKLHSDNDSEVDTGSVVDESWSRYGMAVITGSRAVCGCLLIRRRWSLAPGHCVAARSEPALAQLLPLWRLRYHLNGLTDTKVAESIVHPDFKWSDFRNNIGIFKHADMLMPGDHQISPIAGDDEMLYYRKRNLSLMTWQHISIEIDKQEGVLKRVKLSPLSIKGCRQIVSAIIDIRPYEFCAVLPHNTNYNVEHGAVFMINSEVKGFFSWGDKQGYFPLIMLDIAQFSDWIESETNDLNLK